MSKDLLSLDYETRNRHPTKYNLKDTGHYVYAENAEILMVAASFNYEEPKVFDVYNDGFPKEILEALKSPDVKKSAWNAGFEAVITQHVLGIPYDTNQWECSMAWAASLNLPKALKACAITLGLSDEYLKDDAGKKHIAYFCGPVAATKKNGGRIYNDPEHDPVRYEEFKEYCKQDVRVEIAIRKAISQYPMHSLDRRLWQLDQRINSRGWLIDQEFVDSALELKNKTKEKNLQRITEITNIENPQSISQLKEWFNKSEGLNIQSLNQQLIPEYIKSCDSEVAKEVLNLRMATSKSSTQKLDALKNYIGHDGRARGMFQYYGGHTGRWSGRGPQPQNLPRSEMTEPELRLARQLIKDRKFEEFEVLFG